jgi:hypothetical protein
MDKKKKEGALKKIKKSVRGGNKEKKKGEIHLKSKLYTYAGVVKVFFSPVVPPPSDGTSPPFQPLPPLSSLLPLSSPSSSLL